MMRARRGSALILVLLMTLAIAGLSIAAIFMSSSAGLLSAYYDREREFRLGAESALEMVRAKLNRDAAFAIPDTGMRQVLAGVQINDASGAPIARVRVNVYAAVTGDSSGLQLPVITLIAAAYDAGGTRHVARMDLRRESFSRYALLTDSFPSGLSHGPATVAGRVHSNGAWRLSGSDNRYLDTVTAVGAVTGTGTFEIDSVVGVTRIAYPRDSTFLKLDSLAVTANLSFAPVSGGALGSRLEFVAYDVDGDGTVESEEGFARIFDAAAGGTGDTTRLRASPAVITSFIGSVVRWDSTAVQNQCGVFYLRSGRWHFFPVSAHRRPLLKNVIQSTAGGSYPPIDASAMDRIDTLSYAATDEILELPTARCFPAGSPFLMPAERMTDGSGVVTGTVADSFPFGTFVPPGGWPVGAPSGYGGSDTTFSDSSYSCMVRTSDGRCQAGSRGLLGTWRRFSGTPIGSAPDSVVQAVELPYLWPLSPTHNATSRRVISATSGPLYVSGRVAGNVTLRVAGAVVLVDRVTYVRDPNDASTPSCTDQLGVVATGDILVVNGLTSRKRLVGYMAFGFFPTGADVILGGEPRFTMQGNFMSLTGTVGVEAPTTTAIFTTSYPCPDGFPSAYRGGCLAVSGSMIMKTYSQTHNGPNTGYRYNGTADRCQSTTRRPPFFPLTNRYTFLRTLSLVPTEVNTPAKIRALLMRLKGRPL